jgi:hypothetical protein
MAKLLNTTFLVTQSAPATPSSDFGTLYASGSSLFFKNSNGVNYNLILVGSGSVSVFTGNGTWTKSNNVKYIKVICAGGGGGGGGGRLAAASSLRFGGGGGAGGNINVAYFSSSSLTPGDYNITIGGGGGGGSGRTTTANFGLGGSTGFSSSFASGSTILLRGIGGIGGGGGDGGGGVGGINITQSTAIVPNPYPPFYYSGVNGGNGFTTTLVTASDALSGNRFLAGGGGGGGINTSNISGSGGSGSAIYNYATLIPSGSPGRVGSLNGENGAPVLDVAQLLFYSGSLLSTNVRVGTGGHGGAGGTNSPATSAGNGGNGSLGAGGGGGGGGTAAAGISSGNGSNGGNGFVLIFEYY